MNAPTATGELSRRRVLVGAAWAAPALVVATAVPAAAASTPVLGALVLASTNGSQEATTLSVSAVVTYLGDGQGPADHPVSAVTATISVPATRAGAGNGSTSSSGWAFTSRTTSGANVLFTYSWNGPSLSEANPTTSLLVAVLPRNAAINTPFSVTKQAFGTSNFAPVQSSLVTIGLGTFGGLSVTTTSGYQAATTVNVTGTASFVSDGAAPADNPVTGVTMRVVAPSSRVATTGNGTTSSPGWTFVSRATSGGSVTFIYAWTGALSEGSPATAPLVAILPRATGTNTAFSVTMQAFGTSHLLPVQSSVATVQLGTFGALTIQSPSAVQAASTITASGTLTYAGDGVAPSDNPITGITMLVSVPTARAAAGAGSTSSSGWSYTSRATVGADEVFTFTWNGTLSEANPTTTLVATVPKNATLTAFSIKLDAKGTSNLLAVSAPQQTVAILAPAALTLPNGLAATRGSYTGNARVMSLVASVRNTATNGAAVVGLLARVTVPNGALGAGAPANPTGWTYAGSAAGTGGTTVFTFTYNAGSVAASTTVGPVTFRIPMIASIYFQDFTVSVQFEGKSPTAAGATVNVSASDSIGALEYT